MAFSIQSFSNRILRWLSTGKARGSLHDCAFLSVTLRVGLGPCHSIRSGCNTWERFLVGFHVNVRAGCRVTSHATVRDGFSAGAGAGLCSSTLAFALDCDKALGLSCCADIRINFHAGNGFAFALALTPCICIGNGFSASGKTPTWTVATTHFS